MISIFYSSLIFCLFFSTSWTTGPKVFLTVSSLVSRRVLGQINQRNLTLNYYDADCDRISRSYPFIGLYSHDPREHLRNHMLLYKPTDCPEGKFVTNISFPNFDFTKDDLSRSQCLGYWAAYIESGNLVHSSCIKTQPNWMNQMKDVLSDKSLNCLMIPGTHDSGCYARYDPMRNTVYEKYIFTQDENIFDQLVYGIRQLDLRIWHQNSLLWKSKIKITHGYHHLGLPDLEDVLRQIKDFVSSTNEIVIVDFHRKITGILLPGPLKKEQDVEVINMIKSIFGNLLIDGKFQFASLKMLWRMNQRVLITYTEFDETPVDKYVTYQVRHLWTDVENTNQLHDFLVDNACSHRHSFTAAAAVLTPNKWMPVVDIHFGRRDIAEKVNGVLNKWFRNELSCSNIVMTDYFLGNNIIEIAIEENEKGHLC